jgi:copper chaperone NosL
MNTTTSKHALIILILILLLPLLSKADPAPNTPKNVRCPICGMFVAKYKPWITQIKLSNNQFRYFDGFKDLMVYYFDQEKYETKKSSITEIWVKDYYSLKWINGQNAFFVIGSDVYGPMGHELIPFSKMAAAKNFFKDHQGKKILTFNKITSELIESLRIGQKMR